MELLQIGEVSARTELSIKTIRHYDDVGLVVPSARSAGGFRLYTGEDVARLIAIRRMKPLGFTLEEMRELLEEMRKIKLAEEMEEAQLQRLRAAQKNPLALATNKESPKKLRREDLEETKSIEADENELAFVRSEYTEGLAKLRAQKTLVAKDREEVLRSRPTSAIDRLRLKQD